MIDELLELLGVAAITFLLAALLIIVGGVFSGL